ncbi:zinc-dependent metalloprotease [Pleionea sp. CnH1-48]|uniref:zinc-dependent metalloprotease n=1 Tax=Pleionea sp. CnH1-48 TaxID=2954494 RepID=UPI002097E37D|nr:zinc-dependent metalloprotease [Pleionea sp. CnH1-48]MCO7226610.1 zinc-dependent metalloprotease [Pleionea sp. CnH1-48]
MKLSDSIKGIALSVIVASVASADVSAAAKKNKPSKPKTYEEIIKDKIAYDSFVDFYQDKKTGSLMMVIEEDKLDKPFLYFTHTVNGVLDAGHFKGAFREYKLLEFSKHFDRIEIISKTPRYKLDAESAISRSQGTNISPAILSSMKVVLHDEEKKLYVVKVDPIFLKETLHKVSPYPRPPVPGQPARPAFKIGSLSKSKTKYVNIRSFPKNADIVVEYVFDNKSPMVRGGLEVTDPRTVAVQMQHSFIELPENDYQPRRDDARIGYFSQQFDDLTSDSWAPYQDVINRWHLVKKDPNAAVSEPVEPIVWWIENTTPEEWRETIKTAAETWNVAFEKAGFKNALQVKVQPDDADWDAGDIRYNVLRWTASPRPPFGGYGPSVANPLTGQIIASDIMLEYSFLKNRWLYDAVYTGGATMEEMVPEAPEGIFCSAGHMLHDSTAMAGAVLKAQGGSKELSSELVKQSLSYLILHELGHTLGLNHNMKATQLHNATDVHDSSITQGVVAGSVMDYPAVNIAPPGVKQGDFTNSKPGPYDLWAIEYGYSPAVSDPAEEEKRLQAILARSTEPALTFGNDADDMRRAGLHIDPRVMIGDMSSEAVKYNNGRMDLIKETLKTIKDKTLEKGDTYQELLISTNYLLGEYRRSAEVTSRYIGGIYLDRALVGQDGETQPFTPVPVDIQKAAMDSLSKYMFAPSVLEEAKPLYAYLQRQRRGFNAFAINEDPKIHDMVLNAQKRVLDHVMHRNVMKRMVDTGLYGNQYELNEFMQDLTDAIFEEDKNSDVNTHRQNLQTEYVNRLIRISGLKGLSTYDYLSRAAAINQLSRLQNIGKYSRYSASTNAHRNYLRMLVNKALEKA